MLADGEARRGARRRRAYKRTSRQPQRTITPEITGRIQRILCGPPRAPDPDELFLNEFLADPASGAAGDANGDGTRDASHDEFVELVNTSTSVLDLSGVVVSDFVGIRHVFTAGTYLACGHAIVVFGGGDPTASTWGANWVVAQSATLDTLGLNNDGDVITLGSSELVTDDLGVYDYTGLGASSQDDQSWVAQPEATAGVTTYALHSDAPGANRPPFSPARRVDSAARLARPTPGNPPHACKAIPHPKRAVHLTRM